MIPFHRVAFHRDLRGRDWIARAKKGGGKDSRRKKAADRVQLKFVTAKVNTGGTSNPRCAPPKHERGFGHTHTRHLSNLCTLPSALQIE